MCDNSPNPNINFNHMLIMPMQPFTCYMDTASYGKFNVFISRYSLLTVTYDSYMKHNNECSIYNKSVEINKGATFVIDTADTCDLMVKV